MSGRDDELERRYRHLLRLYPRWYHEQRGPEMLATLLETAGPDTVRPAWREIGPLVLGALRTRLGATVSASPGRLWLSALRVTVLLLTAYATAYALGYALVSAATWRGSPQPWLTAHLDHLVAVLVGTLALVATATGRYRRGLLLVAVLSTVELWIRGWPPFGPHTSEFGAWQEVVLMLLMLPLLRHRPAPTRQPLGWLLAIPFALVLLPNAFSVSYYLGPVTLLAVGVVLLLWSALDARAPVVAAGLLLPPALSLAVMHAGGATGASVLLAGHVGIVVVLAGIGAVRIRQQARL
ncbi:hypothetical protein [Plantactinospora sonchi]|uniref:Integral membrane protein n=1 Tax=Plantactinospora sonchi TaxID=1544735 RepID=A0ABU7RN43_9ACTN